MRILFKQYRRWWSKALLLTVTILELAGVYAFSTSKISNAWEFPKSNPGKEKHVPQEIRRLHVKETINAVAWNADGSRLAALSNYGSIITVWETKTWTVLKEFRRYSGGYSQNSFAYLPDGTLLTAAPITQAAATMWV